MTANSEEEKEKSKKVAFILGAFGISGVLILIFLLIKLIFGDSFADFLEGWLQN